jgi:DNA-binding Lrp family transcriptional regulator
MTTGYVAIHCDTGRELQVYERVREMPRVKEINLVLGLYDVICKLETGSTKELEDAVMTIRKISHVQTTMTLIVF